MRQQLATTLVLLSTGLAGAQSRPPAPVPPADLSRAPIEIIADIQVTLDGLDAEKVRALLARQSISALETARAMADRTRLIDVPEIGTHVLYTSADGKLHLWSPGNSRVLTGAWKVRVRRESLTYTDPAHAPTPELAIDAGPGATYEASVICLDLGESNNDAALILGQRSDTCASLPYVQRLTRESVRTDLFSLATRAEVPFLLTRDPATLADLEKGTR